MLCKGLLTAYRQDNVYCLNLYTICCSYMTLDVSGRGGCKVKILKYLFVTYFCGFILFFVVFVCLLFLLYFLVCFKNWFGAFGMDNTRYSCLVTLSRLFEPAFFQWKKCSAVTLKKIQCDTHIQHGGLLLVKNYLFTCKYKHLSISYWEFCRRGDLKTLHLLCIWWIMRYWRSNLTC